MSDFIPATREIEIGEGIVYRPLRSWHSGVYAGEGLEQVNGDKSGCVRSDGSSTLKICGPPYSYTHRLYWKQGTDPNLPGVFSVSAFLSYPRRMSSQNSYHWEMCPSRFEDDIERFDSEEEMELAVKELFWMQASGTLVPRPSREARAKDLTDSLVRLFSFDDDDDDKEVS